MGIVANVIPFISKSLTHISNNSFKTGVFPSRMKIAKIKPIFNSGAKTDIGNYRPISLLPQLKKKKKKLFLNRLDNFINAKDIQVTTVSVNYVHITCLRNSEPRNTYQKVEFLWHAWSWKMTG